MFLNFPSRKLQTLSVNHFASVAFAKRVPFLLHCAKYPFIVLFCLFISFCDCNIPLPSLPLIMRINFPRSYFVFSSTPSLYIWLGTRWYNGIDIHRAGTVVVWRSRYPSPLLLSAYLARLIWSHLPLLYYTHCAMVEDGIWKKIWLIRYRVYEQVRPLPVSTVLLHLRVDFDYGNDYA